MLDIKYIEENKSIVKKNLGKRGVRVNLDEVIKLNKKRKKQQQILDNLRQKQNEIGPDFKEFNDERKKALHKLKFQIKDEEFRLERIQKKLNKILLNIPNILQGDVPKGSADNNKIIKEVGEKRDFEFKPKNYMEIARKMDIIDIERASKVSGTRFNYLKGKAVFLELALINYAINSLTKQGFVAVIPPVMIREDCMRGMGYMERGEEEIYRTEKDKLYLVGTSEQSIIPMHRNEIFSAKELPKRYIAFSTCFRREAGAYGKDTAGILRVHQFDKVEMVSFVKPEDSPKEHKFLLSMQEKLMQGLDIPYRVVHLAAGDTGDPSSSTFDVETWLPGQNQYRETHSTSNTTDYQTRRLNIRYRDEKEGKNEFVHALNGTGFAIGRTIIAIVENYQTPDGNIEIPPVLKEYIR